VPISLQPRDLRHYPRQCHLAQYPVLVGQNLGAYFDDDSFAHGRIVSGGPLASTAAFGDPSFEKRMIFYIIYGGTFYIANSSKICREIKNMPGRNSD
jgi:hypothetical protein